MKEVVSDRETVGKIQRRETFRNSAGSFWGRAYGDTFEVYSYSTMIAEYRGGAWWINDTTYSTTTSGHQSALRGAIDARTYYGDDQCVHVIRVPRGAASLEFYAGKVAHQRAARLARAS